MRCKKFSKKDIREIRKWAKKYGAIFTAKEYSQMLKRVLKNCK